MNASSKKSGTIAAELPGAPQTLAQLDALRRLVRETAARVEETTRDHDARLRRWQAQRGGVPRVLGVHVEGPFLNPAHAGAHDRRFLRAPRASELRRLLSRHPGLVKILTLAPELRGAGELIREARSRGIIVGAGHTAASYDEGRAAFERGATRDFATSRLDLEALVPVVEGRLPLAIEAHRAADIRAVLRLADEFGLRLILLGGTEAWQVADELARRRVPVVLKVLQNLPATFEQLGARYDNAALLRRAGVTVALTTNDTHNARNLRQEAGNAVTYGLPWEEALRAITRAPADIWGVGDRYGSLAPGKVANVVVWSGDPLELLTRAELVLIRGQIVPLRSRQTELRDRYRTLDPNARPYRP